MSLESPPRSNVDLRPARMIKSLEYQASKAKWNYAKLELHNAYITSNKTDTLMW